MSNLELAALLSLAFATACGDGRIGGGEPQDGSTPRDDAGETPTNVASTVPVGCELANFIAPFLPDEGGHFAAVTITAPSYPFTASKVTYTLRADAEQCSYEIAHEVWVFVATGGAPGASPSGGAVEKLQVAAATGDAPLLPRAVDLGNPITLQDGERLVVAIQMAVDVDRARSICVESCDAAEANEDWWSNAAEEPFSWVDMVADFGFTTQLAIYAEGTTD